VTSLISLSSTQTAETLTFWKRRVVIASDRNIVIVVAVVDSPPSSMFTLNKALLQAGTLHSIQPDRSVPLHSICVEDILAVK